MSTPVDPNDPNADELSGAKKRAKATRAPGVVKKLVKAVKYAAPSLIQIGALGVVVLVFVKKFIEACQEAAAEIEKIEASDDSDADTEGEES